MRLPAASYIVTVANNSEKDQSVPQNIVRADVGSRASKLIESMGLHKLRQEYQIDVLRFCSSTEGMSISSGRDVGNFGRLHTGLKATQCGSDRV